MSILDWLRRHPRGPRPQADSGAFGFSGIPGEASLATMTREELQAWENADAPSAGRASDAAEADTDAKQDVTSSLNFPLHWTSTRESWDFLFDAAVACEMLAPMPDDRVLDFAAGTGWATELLARVGVRVVSIDLSLEMMRRGRQRLAADSRLVFRGDSAFVAARGQTLPFADGAFDGVLCLNALHHLPSYADALAEIYRVLKPGGRAVFSEPGTAHAVAPLSAFRMREHAVLEKRVSLPLVHRLAREAGFTRMRVVPLRASGTYVFDYTASPADNDALDRMWHETLRLSPGEHSRFMLHKGDDPPADTLLPAQKLFGRLGARIVVMRASGDVRASQPFTDRLRVFNSGSVMWRAHGRRFGGQVTCGLKICDPDGTILREDLGRTPLPHDVAPGEEIELEIAVPGALGAGRYRLRYDMVVEGVTWFEFQGSPCVERQLDIT
jgi:SAM-dependent methyltransferase